MSTLQFKRKWSLVVTTPGGTNLAPNLAGPSSGATTVSGGELHIDATRPANVESNITTQGLDLSALHIIFSTVAADVFTPNAATLRVYNLSAQTAAKIISGGAGSSVELKAGYEGNCATIFQGDLKQAFVGRENSTDTYLELVAADGFLLNTFGRVNASLAAEPGVGVTSERLMAAIVQQTAATAGVQGFTNNFGANFGPVRPRGKVLFGMSRRAFRNFANNGDLSISVQSGQLVLIPRTGHLGTPEDAVVLTSKTGMIGMPRATDQGLEVKCLINPLIKIGHLIRINNDDVIAATIDVAYTAINRLQRVPLTGNSLWRVVYLEYDGDTRGGVDSPWYAKITALQYDPTAGGTVLG